MRRFTLGSGPDRKIVVIELNGSCMSVVQLRPDGSSKRTQKELGSAPAARAASDQMARELLARGFSEKLPRAVRAAKAAAEFQAREAAEANADADADARDAEGPSIFDDLEPAAAAPPVLARLAPAATAVEAPPKKKKKADGKGKNKKKRKKSENGNGSGDELDKRVLAGIGAVGAAVVALVGFLVYDAFLKPPTIVGVWGGSMIEHEVSKKLTHTRYDLVLDDQNHASMTLQQKFTSKGTYSLKGDRLKLNLRDDEGAETNEEYRIVLGRATLDLKDPETGELVVELLRTWNAPTGGGGKSAPALAVPTDLGDDDAARDAALASVDFAPKDTAFRLRYPRGWDHDTGSRPDNTYSWGRFTKGGATIEVRADIQGSLMSGSGIGQQPQEGSEFAPVHRAHELYKRTVSDEFGDYNESKPAVFKGARLGEGRIAQFTASGGGLFGSKVRGYRATLLTNDRRITVLCHCPEKEFSGYRHTFLAVCRSLGR